MPLYPAAVNAHPGMDFVPWRVGSWYISPLAKAFRALVPATSRLYLHPFFSGPDGVTIDQLDVVTTIVGASGTVTRMGLYQISSQTRPFAWTSGQTWATLLLDAGTVVNDSGTGQKTITPGTAQTIPPNTWFAVAGADQVATAATRNVGGQSGGQWWTPFGSTGALGYSSSPGLSLAQDSVTGALPANFVPSSVQNFDSGVGIHRSA